jgi:very-short-patch-repair endonuclease
MGCSVPASQLVSADRQKIPATRGRCGQVQDCACHESFALGREAQLTCWAPEVIMRSQSRQQLKREMVLGQRAHEMRHQLTESESALWAAISRKQLGVAFRRQVPIGNRYIADFLAPLAKLVVEVDGGYHSRRVTADARRTRVIERLGYRVLRLDSEFVLRQLPLAVDAVRNALLALSSQGAP